MRLNSSMMKTVYKGPGIRRQGSRSTGHGSEKWRVSETLKPSKWGRLALAGGGAGRGLAEHVADLKDAEHCAVEAEDAEHHGDEAAQVRSAAEVCGEHKDSRGQKDEPRESGGRLEEQRADLASRCNRLARGRHSGSITRISAAFGGVPK